MRVDVFFTPAELGQHDISRQQVVTLDVLRATSTMVAALANGALWITPTATVEEAQRLARNLGKDVLLCGERNYLPIEGFHLGNSPDEFTTEAVAGKRLIMTTTNGTGALLSTGGRRAVRHSLVASLLNLGAVARQLVDDGGDVTIVCAGREARFAAEDAVGAGLLLARLWREGAEVTTNDAGMAAERLAGTAEGDLEAFLASTTAGRSLTAAGLGSDLTLCAAVDRFHVVPVMRDRQLRL